MLPLVMGALILAVFLFLFQYDRCLLEQDMDMLAVWAGTATAESGAELETMIRRRASEISRDKYVVWEMDTLQITVEGSQVSVKGGGSLTLPLPEWNFWGRGNVWSTRTRREALRLSPADYIRLYRKIMGGE